MRISSRTPEGNPIHCKVCDADVTVEPSSETADAICPRCGSLLWFRDQEPDLRDAVVRGHIASIVVIIAMAVLFFWGVVHFLHPGPALTATIAVVTVLLFGKHVVVTVLYLRRQTR